MISVILSPPRIYPIVNYESSSDPKSHFQRLLEAGYEWIQLRAKTLPDKELLRFAHWALVTRNEFRKETRIIINDRVDVASELNADGVHLGQDDQERWPVSQARKILGSGAIIGLSTHNLAQAKAADKLPVTYIAAGPIFSSTTKSGHADPLGLTGLAEICTAVSKPVVAIGGIDLDRIESVIAAGASSCALISALEAKR